MLCLLFVIILLTITNGGAQDTHNAIDSEVVIVNPVPLSETKPGTESRIVGGSPAAIESYPFAVQVLANNRLSCGGSLLTTRTVLSASHCFVDDRGRPLRVRTFSIRAGSTNLNTGGTVVSVQTITLHPQYHHATVNNDVAVLRVRAGLMISDRIRQAGIPGQWFTVPDNSSVIVVGWGTTWDAGQVPSSVLMHVAVRTVNRDVCSSNYNRVGFLGAVSENMMCAGLLGIGGADACQGDSGGPLIYNGVVVGVTSWGRQCGDPTLPGVYAQVSRYTSWIQRTVSAIGGAESSRVGIAAVVLPLIFLFITS